jgi:hypothetical protein
MKSSALARGTRSMTQQAEHAATLNIHAHRRDRIVTSKNHDTEAQQFLIYNFKTPDDDLTGRHM